MHRRTESTTNLVPQVQELMQAGTYFPKVRRNGNYTRDPDFPKVLLKYFHQNNLSLNSCSQSGDSCDVSLCISSDSPFSFLFSVLWIQAEGLSEVFTRTSTSFLHWIFGVSVDINTETCDEDDGEVDEGVVEEELR